MRNGIKHQCGEGLGLPNTAGPAAQPSVCSTPASHLGAAASSNRLGVTVAELSAEQKQGLEIESGVIIRELQNGPAAMIGLRPGDVITHLNNQAINSVKTFSKVVADLPKNRSVSMRVLRQGRASFITFRLPN